MRETIWLRKGMDKATILTLITEIPEDAILVDWGDRLDGTVLLFEAQP